MMLIINALMDMFVMGVDRKDMRPSTQILTLRLIFIPELPITIPMTIKATNTVVCVKTLAICQVLTQD